MNGLKNIITIGPHETLGNLTPIECKKKCLITQCLQFWLPKKGGTYNFIEGKRVRGCNH